LKGRKLSFNAAFIAHAPDAQPDRHNSMIDTGKYRLFVVVVSDQAEALAASKKLVEEEQVSSILLCPGFSNADVAGISEAVGEGVGVGVARTDAQSGRIAMQSMKDAGWF
jgi:hypothetical protein